MLLECSVLFYENYLFNEKAALYPEDAVPLGIAAGKANIQCRVTVTMKPFILSPEIS